MNSGLNCYDFSPNDFALHQAGLFQPIQLNQPDDMRIINQGYQIGAQNSSKGSLNYFDFL